METKQILDELTRITLYNIEVANSFKNLDLQKLNRRSSTTSWSILECIEHLNRYGDFYIPELNYRITNARYTQPTLQYKPGLLGGYFARMMKAENPTKIKSLKNYNPIGSQLDHQVLTIFISQQEALLLCLDKARHINLIKNKTAISISKLIRLQLGDTFSFLIYHNERHIKQALRVHS
ncbi:DinB family protein [Flavobacterium cerinum]|uniref:DinB family protein n=1 Tax=Flavobacterium cerinum TaxID=2502784 RepID=A0ABY5IPF0_9FLAO|nr:DinB family protein [Flavobacterium cerinum]UUC44634.1 DinB family protein [Flavobacterium cerinum]